MGTVETRAKTLAGGSGPVSESAKRRAHEEKSLQGSIGGPVGSGSGPERTRENGGGVSTSGKEALGSRVVRVVQTRTVETEVSVKKGLGGPDEDVLGDAEGGLEESEMGGVSSLLKMRGSGARREIEVKGLDESESLVKLRTSGGRGTTANGLRGGVASKNRARKRSVLGEESGNKENGGSMTENGGDQDGNIKIIEVPIEDMSESEEWDGREDMAEAGWEFSAGDFVWGKIKSHPWWPGQVYDPLDASDLATKLKARGRLLVAYFGDSTFAWCRPFQLKPFVENFEEMSRQSNTKNFVYAVEKAVDEIGRLLELEMICSCVVEENRDGLDRPLAVNAGIKDGVLVPSGGLRKLSNILSEPLDLLTEMKRVAQTISKCSALGLGVLKSRLAVFYRARGVNRLPMYHEPLTITGLEDNLDDGIVDSHDPVELPIQGPFAEEWLSSPVSPKFGQKSQTIAKKSEEDLDDRLSKRRKRKSIAEIMEGNGATRVKRNDRPLAKEGTNSGKPAPSSRSERRKSSSVNDVLEGSKRKTRMLETDSPLGTNSKVSGVDTDGNGGKEESRKKISVGRRGKDEGGSIEGNGGGGKELTNDGPVTKKRKLNLTNLQTSDGKAKMQIEEVSLSRERKKSKYLSPPFTSLIREQKKKDIEAESPKVSVESPSGERMTTAPPVPRVCNETVEKNLSQELDPEHDRSDVSSPIAQKRDLIPEKVKASANEVLSGLQRAAMDVLYPRENKSFEMVGDFLSILRSSVFCHGSNYEAYKKPLSGRKRKNLDSEAQSSGRDQSITDSKSPGHVSKQRTRKKDKEAESHEAMPKKGAAKIADVKVGKSQSRQGARKSDVKTSDKETDGEASSAVLSVLFDTGSTLPSKADLIRIYGKFGALNEAETDMFHNNSSARIAFVRSSDAEEALNHSLHSKPFKDANVHFELLYPSTATKTRELREIQQPKASLPANNVQDKTPAKPSASQPSLDLVKQKLEEVNSMLEKSGSKVSPKMKCKIEREIKGLLDTVSSMVGSSKS